MQTKYCSKCQQFKPVSEFYKNNRGGCKKCIRAYQKQYYLANYAPPKAIPLPDGLKKCSKCQEIKPIDEFYRDKSQESGRHHQCKICSDSFRRAKRDKLPKKFTKAPMGYKKCPRCQTVKPLGDFGDRRTCAICSQEIDTKKANKKDRKEYGREWKRNPDYQAKQKIYRIGYNQREDVRAKNRKHNIEYRNRPENQEKARQRAIAWRKGNLDKANHQSKIKYYRKKGAEGSHTLDQWLTLLSFFNCCPKCGQDRVLTRDHIIPLTAGGTSYIDNIQPLCRSCNSKKLNSLIIDYRSGQVREWAYLQVNG